MENFKNLFEKELTSIDEKTITIADYIGKPLIVHFWATWCGPCHGFNSLLAAFYQKQGVPEKINIISVSLDGISPYTLPLGDIEEQRLKILDKEKPTIKAFVESRILSQKLAWSHICTYKHWMCPIAAAFGVHGIPAAFLFNKHGDFVSSDRKTLINDALDQIL